MERKKIMPMLSPPVRGTGLLCIFRSAGKSMSQCGPTFMRNMENQIVKAKVSVKGASASIEILSGFQNIFDSVDNFLHNDLFIKAFFYLFSPHQPHLSSLMG